MDTTFKFTSKSDFGIDAAYWRVQGFRVDLRTEVCQVDIVGFPSEKEAGDSAMPLATRTVNVSLPAKVFGDSLAAIQNAVQQVLDAG